VLQFSQSGLLTFSATPFVSVDQDFFEEIPIQSMNLE
jgi:hypothetical protein